MVLLHFSLSVKAVTLISISGRDLAISSTHEGKTGNINHSMLTEINILYLSS